MEWVQNLMIQTSNNKTSIMQNVDCYRTSIIQNVDCYKTSIIQIRLLQNVEKNYATKCQQQNIKYYKTVRPCPPWKIRGKKNSAPPPNNNAM